MIGIWLHSRSWRQTSTPSPSGSTRSMIAASGGCSAAPSSASCGGLRGDDVEAGLAQHDPQAAQDLQLVVADEHPWPRRAHDRSAAAAGGAFGERQLDREHRALTGRRLGVHAAAVGLDEPAHDRQSQPGAGMRVVRVVAVERLERAAQLRRVHARPAVDDADAHLAADDPRAHLDRMPAAVAPRVLEQVDEDALELGGVGPHERQVAVEGQREARRVAARRHRRRRCARPPPASTSRAAPPRRPPAAWTGRAACRRAPTAAAPPRRRRARARRARRARAPASAPRGRR